MVCPQDGAGGGVLVAGGGMMRVQGGIPFPLNHQPCQCGPNRALLQWGVLSLFNRRESLTTVARPLCSLREIDIVLSGTGDLYMHNGPVIIN